MATRKKRTATPKTARLSDEEVIALTAEYEELKAEEAKARKASDAIKEKILEEMKLRKVDKIEWDTGRVSKTAAKKVTLSSDVLRELVSTRVFDSVTTPQIDKTLLAAAVQSGKLSTKILEQISTVTENAPYIKVSHGTGD